MDAIEKAIRSALEKGDASDRAYRERVYRMVHGALERAMGANPGLAPEAIERRRESLKRSISLVESEFIPARAAAPRPAAPVGPMQTQPAEGRPSAPQAAPTEPQRPAGHARPSVEADAGRAPAAAAPRPAPVAAPPPSPRGPAPFAEQPSARPPRGAAPASAPEIVVADEPRVAAPPVVEAHREPVRAGGDLSIAADARERLSGDPEPLLAEREEAPDLGVAPAEYRAAARRNRPWAALFLAATVLAAAGMGLWWVADRGFLKSAAERDTSVPNPPRTLEPEEFTPKEVGQGPARPGDATARDWIGIFSPADPASVTAPAGATAEVIEVGDAQALRIRSSDADAAVLFDVGQGVLEQIAGRNAVFDIVARSEGGEVTQMSVTCNLAELGDCGRNRYNVGGERAEYLFDLDLPAASPGAAGTIAITTDLDSGGKAVDIFEIRVAVSQ